MQKYQERKAALEKSKDSQEKEKWKSVLIMDIHLVMRVDMKMTKRS